MLTRLRTLLQDYQSCCSILSLVVDHIFIGGTENDSRETQSNLLQFAHQSELVRQPAQNEKSFSYLFESRTPLYLICKHIFEDLQQIGAEDSVTITSQRIRDIISILLSVPSFYPYCFFVTHTWSVDLRHILNSMTGKWNIFFQDELICSLRVLIWKVDVASMPEIILFWDLRAK